jgi:hypothetical protein
MRALTRRLPGTKGLPFTLAGIALMVLVASAAATAVRYGLIERDDVGTACDALSAKWWCTLRMLVIQGFLNDIYGRASVALAALALWRRSAIGAWLAIAVGTWGMVLYTFTWSGVGVLGGAMALARLQGQWREDGETEQEAR